MVEAPLLEAVGNINKHAAIQVLWERKRGGSVPWKRTDGRKVGAVIEGGAIRGIVSAAELVEVASEGLLPSFDAFYGESVGGPNGAWVASGNMQEAIRVYYEDINNREFVNPWRLFSRRPVVDIDYLEEVVMKKYPINFQAMVDTGIDIGLLIARADKQKMVPGQGYPLHLVRVFCNREDFIKWCKVGMQMPIFSGPPVDCGNGMRGWDAGIVDKLPVQTAINDGCTDIIVFSCVSEDYKPRQYPLAVRLLMKHYLGKYNKDLVKYFGNVKPRYAQTLDYLRHKNTEMDGSPSIATFFLPKGFRKIGSFETDYTILRSVESAAQESVHQMLYARR